MAWSRLVLIVHNRAFNSVNFCILHDWLPGWFSSFFSLVFVSLSCRQRNLVMLLCGYPSIGTQEMRTSFWYWFAYAIKLIENNSSQPQFPNTGFGSQTSFFFSCLNIFVELSGLEEPSSLENFFGLVVFIMKISQVAWLLWIGALHKLQYSNFSVKFELRISTSPGISWCTIVS